MAVVTDTEYKTWAGTSGTALDSWLAQVIDEAQGFAEEWCGRQFESGTKTEYYDGLGATTIEVRSPPINSLTSVSYLSGVSSGAPSYTAFDSGSYWYDSSSGILSRYNSFDAFQDTTDIFGRSVWPDGCKNIRVIYDGGYGSQGGAAVPDALKLAMYRFLDFLRELRGKSGSLQSETMGSYSYTRASISATVGDDRMYEFGFGPYRRVSL